MKMKLRLQAGNPNDANRDYVPMGIKGTDMTVNENGNNSQVYPFSSSTAWAAASSRCSSGSSCTCRVML